MRLQLVLVTSLSLLALVACGDGSQSPVALTPSLETNILSTDEEPTSLAGVFDVGDTPEDAADVGILSPAQPVQRSSRVGGLRDANDYYRWTLSKTQPVTLEITLQGLGDLPVVELLRQDKTVVVSFAADGLVFNPAGLTVTDPVETFNRRTVTVTGSLAAGSYFLRFLQDGGVRRYSWQVEVAESPALRVDSLEDAPDLIPGDGLCQTAAGSCTLRAAVQEALPGSDITFAVTGTITLAEPILIDKPLRITGPGEDQLTVQGTYVFESTEGRVFEIIATATNPFNVEFNDMTLSGDIVDLDGGVILNHFSTLSLNHVTLSDARVGEKGGCLFNDQGRVTLTNSTITGCEAFITGGGAIYSFGGDITLNSTLLDQNTVGGSGFGSAIFSDGSNLTLNGTTVLQGHSACSTIEHSDGILTMNDQSTIRNNSIANCLAGGIYNTRGMVFMNDDSSIVSNSGDVECMGVFNFNGTVELNDNSTIANNSIGSFLLGDGGGVCNEGGLLTLNDNSSIVNNSADGNGGGIYNTGQVILNGGLISGNEAVNGNGGGIFNTGAGTVTGNLSIVTGNTPDDIFPAP